MDFWQVFSYACSKWRSGRVLGSYSLGAGVEPISQVLYREDFSLDDIFYSAGLQPIKRRTSLRLRRSSKRGVHGDQDPLTEQDCRDVLAREVYEARNIGDDVRRQILSQLIQVSPGGILAFAWLCVKAGETITVERIRSFCCEIANPETVMNLTREASQEPLGVKDSLFCTEAILIKQELSRSDRICAMVCLMLSNCLSEEGRSAALEHSLEVKAFNSADRRVLCQWAMGLDVSDEISKGFLYEMPLPPAFLARMAIPCLVRIGEDATKVIRHILDNIECWNDTKPILQGVLDLMEMRERSEAQNSLRLRIYELCLASPDASLRRRAYSLGAITEGVGFLHRALKDKDLGVRNWAISYVNSREN